MADAPRMPANLLKPCEMQASPSLKTLVRHQPEALTAIRNIGPVFVAQTSIILKRPAFLWA